jgi:hypothetical protein
MDDVKGESMVQQFNDLYGMDEEDLHSWKALCRILNIDPIPEGLRRVVVSVYHVWVVPLNVLKLTNDH